MTIKAEKVKTFDLSLGTIRTNHLTLTSTSNNIEVRKSYIYSGQSKFNKKSSIKESTETGFFD